MNDIVLFGAGACGRESLAYLRKQGITPLAFADNNQQRWGSKYEGLDILSPKQAFETYPDAMFVVTIYQRMAKEVRTQLSQMGVKLAARGSFIPIHSELPLEQTQERLLSIVSEEETIKELKDQFCFRQQKLDLDTQREPSEIKDIYFPDFITSFKDEVFVDCGAADGDTIKQFTARYSQYKNIIAFEPDHSNFSQLPEGITKYECAVGNMEAYVKFASNGDTSSHIDPKVNTVVKCVKLDSYPNLNPTFIKMDIEGAEIDAIKGARFMIQVYKPVLAICAYHLPEHLWEIPFLLHTMVPSYDLRLRRYAEGASELVWYAVPKHRLV